MLAAGRGGAIVNITSDATLGGQALMADDEAAKHAALWRTRTVALEHARDGVRINSVAPGPILTPMLSEADAAVFAKLVPAGRVGLPAEVADAVVWLCSDRASFIHGQVLPVDGGLSFVSSIGQGLPC